MKKSTLLISGMAFTLIAWFCLISFNATIADNSKIVKPGNDTIIQSANNMKLGAFSVSLNVKDLKASKQFYEDLGFTTFGGGLEMNYLIMKNENTLIGLFQGMFEKTMLTFNPGWDQNANNLEEFNDIREIQKRLKSKDIKIDNQIEETGSGPASFIVKDPDGNIILFDQHR